MATDKAQQLGHDLSHLAASISKIAEEIKAIGGSEPVGTHAEPEPQAAAPSAKTLTLEEVRGILADKASSGHRDAVQALIHKHGAQAKPRRRMISMMSSLQPATMAIS